VLLCSHLLADVEDVCRRVAVLYGGRQQTTGNIHELLSQDNLTQITTERLSEEAINRIRRLVEQEEQKQVVSVSAPTARLETFFLQVVREAQAARPEISGAVAGGRIASFLAESEPPSEAIVESLIAASARPVSASTEEAAAPPARPEEPAEEVIADLLTGKPASPSESPAGEDPAHKRADEPDQEVINRLLGGAGPRDRRED